MRIPVSLTLLLAVVSMPAWARGTIDKVHIRGLEDSPAMENNVRLALGVTSVVGKVQGESRLELLLFNAEREARQALEPFGYYSPGIQVDSPRNASDRITVTVRIDRGQPVRVRQSDVSIVGPAAMTPTWPGTSRPSGRAWARCSTTPPTTPAATGSAAAWPNVAISTPISSPAKSR